MPMLHADRNLVPILPIWLGSVKPGQFLKILEFEINYGCYSLVLEPVDEVQATMQTEAVSQGQFEVEIETWISSPLGRYLGLRLCSHLIAEDRMIVVCPVRIIASNILACLTDDELVYLKQYAKFENTCADVEQFIPLNQEFSPEGLLK